jgi:hypothetical protein
MLIYICRNQINMSHISYLEINILGFYCRFYLIFRLTSYKLSGINKLSYKILRHN